MEYTKDMILYVNYGQEVKSRRKFGRVFYKISSEIAKHKIMSAVVSITIMLMFLDIILVSSFIDILGSMTF